MKTPAEQNAALLETANVSYAYGSLWAVRDVSLHVQTGELVALVGRNGAGKSTLLRCLAGWAPVTAGEVRVLGLPVARAERAVREHVVLVPDTPPFYDELSASRSSGRPGAVPGRPLDLSETYLHRAGHDAR